MNAYPCRSVAMASVTTHPLSLTIYSLSARKVISADTLPIRGWDVAGAGELLLRSTCWSVSSHRPDKDGVATGEFGRWHLIG